MVATYSLEAGAKVENARAEAKAQLGKIEEKRLDNGQGAPEIISSISEGPKLDGSLKNGMSSIGTDGKVKLEATIGVVKFGVEIDPTELDEGLR